MQSVVPYSTVPRSSKILRGLAVIGCLAATMTALAAPASSAVPATTSEETTYLTRLRDAADEDSRLVEASDSFLIGLGREMCSALRQRELTKNFRSFEDGPPVNTGSYSEVVLSALVASEELCPQYRDRSRFTRPVRASDRGPRSAARKACEGFVRAFDEDVEGFDIAMEAAGAAAGTASLTNPRWDGLTEMIARVSVAYEHLQTDDSAELDASLSTALYLCDPLLRKYR
jgi:hypothetical protein